MHTTIDSPSLNGSGNEAGSVKTITIPPKRKQRWIAAAAAIVIIIALVAGIIIYRSQSAGAVTYTTVPVARQTLVQSVTATGTLNPQNTIAVGTQQSGTISEIDVDFNSKGAQGPSARAHRRHDASRPTSIRSSVNSRKRDSNAQAANVKTPAVRTHRKSTRLQLQLLQRPRHSALRRRPRTVEHTSDRSRRLQHDESTSRASHARTTDGERAIKPSSSQGYLAQNQLDADQFGRSSRANRS